MKRTPIAVTALLLLALAPSSLLAYRIFLKDGTSLSAQAKYEVQGDRAWVTLESGAQTVLPLAEIDVARTDEYNKKHRYATGGVVIDGAPPRGPGETDASERTLQDLIRTRRDVNAPEPEEQSEPLVKLRKTPAGYEDLASLTRQPVEDEQLQQDLTAILRGEGLALFILYRGSRPGRVFVEVVTEGEGDVFAALKKTCAGLLKLREAYPAVVAFEVLMKTSNRSRAGQFVLTPANAPLLVNGRMSAADFFVEHVEF